jgi:nickel-dependent lactate racemase
LVSHSIPYGTSHVSMVMQNESFGSILRPKDLPGVRRPNDAIREALEKPIGTERLSEMAGPTDSVAIVVNDITRPVSSEIILPPILEELHAAGVPNDNVVIVVATGAHRPDTEKELRGTLGNRIYENVKVVNHNCFDQDNLEKVGTTKRNVPVEINKLVSNAKIKILTGLIAPHHCAGYSGGRKSVLPGIASIKSIGVHHSFPIFPKEPALGWVEGNPFHEEALEGARMVGIDFIVNVVFNSRREIVKIVAGDLYDAWAEGYRVCDDMSRIKVARNADIVVTSPGGYPRDINLWQSQKAISAAELVVKDGGTIILVAQCIDGWGEERLRWFDWLTKASNPREVVERFAKENFTEGSMKAYMFARALERTDVHVVTDGVSKKDLEKAFMKPESSLQEALEGAMVKHGRDCEIVVMPESSYLVPTVSGKM